MAKGSGTSRSSSANNPKGLKSEWVSKQNEKAPTQSFQDFGIDKIWAYSPESDGYNTPMSLSNYTFSLSKGKFDKLKKQYPDIGEYGGGGNDVQTRVIKSIIGHSVNDINLAARLNASDIGQQNWKVSSDSTNDIAKVEHTDMFGNKHVIAVRLKKKK